MNFKGALAALRIDAASVAQMASDEPRLLQLDPLTFKSRVDGMMTQLYLPRKQVSARLRVRVPCVMCARTFVCMCVCV